MTFVPSARLLRSLLPAFSLTVILIAIFYLQPRAMSYFGLNLLLNLALPIAFATLAQMCVIAVNDLDLGIGAFVGFVACVGATWLNESPVLGIAVLLLCILAYAALGALIHLRNLPSIVVTLGMSFFWLGLALLVLPTPGGKAPEWVRAVMTFKAPGMPTTIYASALVAILVHFALMRSAYGAVVRGVGGNPRSVERAGWSILKAKMSMYALAGFFGVLSGISLIGLTTSADANIALRYTLLSIAGVILGGGEFVGGRISPVGAVLGAMTLTLAASFLSFLRISPDWQIGAQGAILIIVLALRVLINRAGKK
ncbi:ABC transporter permease [Denitrobaculum tricleocarpae]|uniref:ABC transporter permease n=1 Tax=Denitrobaculum tricleocarpae TaxID=2591009 RepID=A0A545U2H1_9PROT|nr:ABC transporter permease [Denitrobaculum tricleocarpae]TQV83671.1 ABC transporter permease [Denitrobaculum tricleocarpae]